jgi:tellurite resistance protein TehA-like permease
MTIAIASTSTRPPAARRFEGAVRQFTPNWFTATMGTGILALALNQAPFATPELCCVAEGLWFMNIALFALLSLLYTARWLTFPREAARIFSHSVMSMFFGAIPMGLATIINGFLVFGVARWGEAAVTIADTLWWLDMAMAVVCGVSIPFLMFTRQDHSIEKMTAVWLLPIVAAEVTASSAGLLVPHLADPHAALRMLVLGYALWAYSVPLAMSVLVILLLRLVLHKLPHKDMAASGWLALGPIGTGALGLLLLGADAPRAFAAAGVTGVGEIAAGIGVIGGALLWGYGRGGCCSRCDDDPLSARRHAVQPRLVGLHLPAWRLCRGDAGPGSPDASGIPGRDRRRPDHLPGAVLDHRRRPYAAWRLARTPVRFTLLDERRDSQRPRGRLCVAQREDGVMS